MDGGEDANRGRLCSLAAHRQKDAVKFGREETCSRSFDRSDPRRLFVVIRVLLFKYRDGALASNGINSLAGFIVEHVIAITDGG